ncbi:MAG: VOC family protein [Deltaproteobacteria bacterium]|nr:VOC family protein [Deltaproteobacteria bacterium]
MSKGPTSALSFTKLVVDDLEKMTAFYCDVYGMKELQRVQAHIGTDPIDETILSSGEDVSVVLILMKYLEKAPPTNGEVLLGFRTDDIEKLFARIRAAGGGIYLDIKDEPGAPYKAGFATDPEGHLTEILQFNE